MASPKTILTLPGDGIGPEIVAEAAKLLALFPHLHVSSASIGGAALESTAGASALPEATLAAARRADAILLGAVGTPYWSHPDRRVRPEHGLLALRRELDLYANLRPVFFPADACRARSPLKESALQGFTRSMMVRELVSGIYFGERKEAEKPISQDSSATDVCTYTYKDIERVTRLAGQLAMRSSPPEKITLVDKANVLATSRLWRAAVAEVLAREFPQVPWDVCLVDAAAMHMIRRPASLNGIVLTENLFGDILSDEASVIPGSLGLMPSASLSGLDTGRPGVYEPIHGSAPDIAGQGVANPVGTLLSVAMMFRHSLGMPHEAAVVERAVRDVLSDPANHTPDLGGTATTARVGDAVAARVAALLRKVRRPMSISEKILAHAAVAVPADAPAHVRPGDMMCVKVDWTLASELTWKGMEKTYDQMGRPAIHDRTRFWLAVDHTVDPRIMHEAKPRALVAASRRFAEEARLTDFHGPNETILHTEFCRQRAQPGQVIVGADSHSCSAGNVGAFALGLGAADVTMPLCTGETWMRVPEVVRIDFVGSPPFGIGGKDAILHVLGELKRNTVTFERAVEFGGAGARHLSVDARFAIANMVTELGGCAAVFEADEVTAAYLARRPAHNSAAKYFRADAGAEYASRHVIDLAAVGSLVALYPSPDNVVPVAQVAGTKLDGCFIGACTTAEEDLILGGLVLRAGLARGLVPALGGKRKVTPGSVQITTKLKKLGLIEAYERAGFEVGAPGCSYCLGIAADVAGEGEVWLSSQNRNFKNRMGKGSIGNLASAATVAASAFDMKITDPAELLAHVDRAEFRAMCDALDVSPSTLPAATATEVAIMEPKPERLQRAQDVLPAALEAGDISSVAVEDPAAAEQPDSGIESDGTASGGEEQTATAGSATSGGGSLPPLIRGRAQVFGDHIDTDQIIPAPFMPGKDNADLGTHCFEFYRPEFRDRAQNQGCNIVVAGEGFGSGSSREEAPRALLGCGVQAVIAKGFAFIYGRNQYNMALLGLVVSAPRFYELATEGADIEIRLPQRVVAVAGETFPFALSDFEERLVAGGGVTELYRKYGKKLFRVSIAAASKKRKVAAPAAGPEATPPSGGCGAADAAEGTCGTSEAALAW